MKTFEVKSESSFPSLAVECPHVNDCVSFPQLHHIVDVTSHSNWHLVLALLPLVKLAFLQSNRSGLYQRASEYELELETIFSCPHTVTFRTRPLAGTVSGMTSDSVRGRGRELKGPVWNLRPMGSWDFTEF